MSALKSEWRGSFLGMEQTAKNMPVLPEVGNVVEVRGATWAVTDVQEQGISRSPADESHGRKQHVISLQSLEEDRMGDELSVIWELEVGQSVDCPTSSILDRSMIQISWERSSMLCVGVR